jgi:hypothetical protein
MCRREAEVTGSKAVPTCVLELRVYERVGIPPSHSAPASLNAYSAPKGTFRATNLGAAARVYGGIAARLAASQACGLGPCNAHRGVTQFGGGGRARGERTAAGAPCPMRERA